LSVSDTVANRDGSDAVAGAERLAFADLVGHLLRALA
jgi:hypothetical protein